jgi:hypothetical protein
MAKRNRSFEPGSRRAPVRLGAVRVIFEPDPAGGELVCVYAEAEIEVCDVVQFLTSGGRCGLDPEEDLAPTVLEEWKTLRDVLKTVGVPTEELPLEIDRAWIEWRM